MAKAFEEIFFVLGFVSLTGGLTWKAAEWLVGSSPSAVAFRAAVGNFMHNPSGAISVGIVALFLSWILYTNNSNK